MALSSGTKNRFVVRHSGKELVLSKCIRGWKSHDIIHRSPLGYRLDGKELVFRSVPEMIAHYQQHPIKFNQVLGEAIESIPESQSGTTNASTNVFMQSKYFSKISWRRCADSPVSNAIPPTVKIGDNVYVGSGLRDYGAQETAAYIIFKYNITSNVWSSLPECPTKHHGLAALDNEVVAIGGCDKLSIITSSVYTFRDSKWQEVLPPMSTPRYLLSATSYQNKVIIAAGGTIVDDCGGDFIYTDKVEIYKDGRWYNTKRLCFPLSQFTIQMIGDTCYTLGGVTTTYDHTNTSLCSTVSSLLKCANSARNSTKHPTMWQRLLDMHPLTFSSPVEMDGRLVVMGGSVDSQRRQGSKFISTYDFSTDS